MLRGILFLSLALASVVSAGPALLNKIEKSERTAVVVVELATHAPADRRFFYEFVEAAAHAETKNRIRPVYGKVILLSGQDATLDKLMSSLGTAAADPRTKAIDVFVNLHGSPGALSLREGSHETAAMSEKMLATKGLSEK